MKVAIAGILIGVFICNTATFQKLFSPEEYWSKKIRKMELTAQFVAEEARISDLRGDIESASVLNNVLRGLDGSIADAKRNVR